MLSGHFVNEKERKLNFYLPNKSKWVFSYSTKGTKLKVQPWTSLLCQFMFWNLPKWVGSASLQIISKKSPRRITLTKKMTKLRLTKKVFKPRRHGHLSFLSSVNCQMPNLTFFVLWLLSANFWLGLYILNFLSILSDFFSWEKSERIERKLRHKI